MTNTESVYCARSYESVFTNKIAFIEVTRDYTGCSLKDAKNLVDSFINSCDAVKKSDASFLEQVRQVIADPRTFNDDLSGDYDSEGTLANHYADMARISAIVENWREANPF